MRCRCLECCDKQIRSARMQVLWKKSTPQVSVLEKDKPYMTALKTRDFKTHQAYVSNTVTAVTPSIGTPRPLPESCVASPVVFIKEVEVGSRNPLSPSLKVEQRLTLGARRQFFISNYGLLTKSIHYKNIDTIIKLQKRNKD